MLSIIAVSAATMLGAGSAAGGGVRLVAGPGAGADAQPIVDAGYLATDGAHATIHVVRHADGSTTGAGQWLYADSDNLYIDVDQTEISADGTSAYLSGVLFIASKAGPSSYRYALKLIDTGEGSNASGPDMESYIVYANDPSWDLTNPGVVHLVDDPSAWGLPHWFQIQAGNIQVHGGK